MRALEASEPADLIRSIHRRSGALAKELVDFWTTWGVDWERGGFYGRHDINGRPDASADKGLIQQARHLWTFSFLRSLNYAGRVEEFAPISDHAFRFLSRFYGSDIRFFRFQMDARASKFTDRSEQFYGNAYVIYSLAQYAMSAPIHRALAQGLAMDVYQTLVQRGFDSQHGGFDQTHDPWYFTADQKNRGFIKDYNTHLHLLEAFTVLYQLTHDADVLGRGDEKDAIAKLVRVGNHAMTQGVDPVRGGWFEEGVFGQGVTKTNKVWWAQAEALPGLWKLYQWTSDRQYLDQIGKTLAWIETYQRKKDVGEWYWDVKADGTADLSRYDDIGALWKTSYHTTRALVLLQEWTS